MVKGQTYISEKTEAKKECLCPNWLVLNLRNYSSVAYFQIDLVNKQKHTAINL